MLDKINMEIALSWKPGICVYDGRRDNPLSFEVIRIYFLNIYNVLEYWRTERARKKNKDKKNLWTPSHTRQISTQDPTSDKSEGGGVRPPPPLDPRMPELKKMFWSHFIGKVHVGLFSRGAYTSIYFFQSCISHPYYYI